MKRRWGFVALYCATLACNERDDATKAAEPGTPVNAQASAGAESDPAAGTSANAASSASAAATATPAEVAAHAAANAGARLEHAASAAKTCPAGQLLINGGEFWMGSAKGVGLDDEQPRFKTQVSDFCMDRTEVTTAAFAACIQQGKCERGSGDRVTCNLGQRGREEHPVNCVSHIQAERYCQEQGQRLPTELEWEYAARGGGEYRKFSWGSENPDQRSCWKAPHSCKAASFAPGAFGLYDMTGNVWEWTADYYGRYPWPPKDAATFVYRGGSWSRRFEKWMLTTLRNRFGPSRWGSHLGFRCASSLASESCLAGKAEDGRCLHVVLEMDCPLGTSFNGVRCAAPGAPECPGTSQKQQGFGCVSPSAPVKPNAEAFLESLKEVRRVSTPEFDRDCRQYQPSRPHAFRFTGASHDARTKVVQSRGCKNRDVGAGWNSACCP